MQKLMKLFLLYLRECPKTQDFFLVGNMVLDTRVAFRIKTKLPLGINSLNYVGLLIKSTIFEKVSFGEKLVKINWETFSHRCHWNLCLFSIHDLTKLVHGSIVVSFDWADSVCNTETIFKNLDDYFDNKDKIG